MCIFCENVKDLWMNNHNAIVIDQNQDYVQKLWIDASIAPTTI